MLIKWKKRFIYIYRSIQSIFRCNCFSHTVGFGSAYKYLTHTNRGYILNVVAISIILPPVICQKSLTVLNLLLQQNQINCNNKVITANTLTDGVYAALNQ